MTNASPTIALVAGEASGDLLGGGLVEALSGMLPNARFVGVGGPRMKAAGVTCWHDVEELAVMGLFEVLAHFPRLLSLRRDLVGRLADLRPDVFIGIDAPDFNLGLETRLRRRGLRTVHYVSPTVWAWRQRRVNTIRRAADQVLCLFPFEPEFYRGHGVNASYVGHPMADEIEPDGDPQGARRRLGLAPDTTTIALLPGSRVGEVERLAEPMIEAARILTRNRPDTRFIGALANERVEKAFRQKMDLLDFKAIQTIRGDARTVIAAADTVICASGTATLETMLINRPLVMTYRISASSYYLAMALGLGKQPFFALPNILAGQRLIPELVQQQATGEELAAATERWLDDPGSRSVLKQRFLQLHRQLECGASVRAAEEVCRLLEHTD
jgi:lipid-A-disaccharide synthase